MRGYGGDEVDEYDEYEDEGEEQYEEDEEGEEEIEEEEERKPTAEELEYLELRKRLKERYRKKFKKESSSALSGSQEKKNRLPYDNYGSFFGPSKPVISQRVIQESKSLLETQHLANKASHSHRGNEKMSATTGSKAGAPRRLPKVNQLQSKVQKIKVSRDYSFLSDDAELPAAKRDPPARNISRPNSEARSAPLPIKNKQPLGSNGRNVQGAREERKPIPSNGQMHSKAGPYKSTSGSKPNLTPMDARKQHSSSNGIGPGRPAGPKPLPSKMPVAPMVKKASASGAKYIPPSTKVPQPSSKMTPPVQKKHLEQRKGLEEPNRGKMGPKQMVAPSKPQKLIQMNKPVKQIPARPMVQDHRPKKKPLRRYSDDEDGDDDAMAFSMLRSMLGPRKFANYDDDDDSDMEAGFDDIMREEKRSAKIARKEDEEQLRLIEEEERQERMRKLAKKRKLSQRN